MHQSIERRLERLEEEMRPPEVWKINNRIVRVAEGGGVLEEEVNHASYFVGREECGLWRTDGESLEQFEERAFQAAFQATGYYDITTSREDVCTN